jgi:uncharacterized repeat protein (TIGR01451 family)
LLPGVLLRRAFLRDRRAGVKAKVDSARRSVQARTRAAVVAFAILLAALLIVGLTSAANPALPPNTVFELDGNGFTTPSSTLADWNCLYTDPTTNPTPTNCPATQPAAKTSLVSDKTLDTTDDILGTGSKDILDIPQWDLVSQKPPAKDDLAHAAWANYSVPVDGAPHDILYFTADRISNNGDAFMGFWFFKGDVGESGGEVAGTHQAGDTLVLVNFIQGSGQKSDVQEIGVYKWVTDGSGDINGGTLKTVVPLTEAQCVGSDQSISACAQFNTDTQPSVWPFQSADSGDLPNFWTKSEFVEGGIDFTALLGDEACFTSVMAETRSSDSPTAEQKDIVFGKLNTCGTVKIVKDAQPNDPQSFGFTAQDGLLPSPGTFSLVDNGDAAAATKEITNVKAGTYHVLEGAATGWNLTGISCEDPTSNSSGDTSTRTATINVAASETITCTFTNVKPPKLTVNKVCAPTNDTGKFNLRVDSNTVKADAACGTGTGAQEYAIGDHTVSETAGTGTSLADYTSVVGGDCGADGKVTLNAGDNKTCTITNTHAAKLTVNKVCVPANDTGKFNLQIDAQTAGTGANAACGGTTGAVTLVAGPHTVGETAGTGTDLANYTSVISGACAADGTVTLAAGDNKTCTITNTHKTTLTVNKICAPANDSGKFNLQIDGQTAGTGASAGCGGTTGAVTVSATQHTVGETAVTGTDLANYTSVIGGACAADGKVTLATGDNKVCTITNTRKPTLTVNKVCVPTTDNGKFNLQIDGNTPAGTGANAACGGTTGAVNTSVGTHTVGETAGTGTNLATDYFTPTVGGDCAANGSITLAAGQNAVCTLTNYRKGSIAITKTPATQAVNSGGTATFTITVINTGPVDLTAVTVTDPLSTNCAKTIGALAAGASSTYTCTQANVTAAFTNVATVTGHPPFGPDLTASVSANVTVNPPPSSPPASTPTPTPTPTPTVDLAIVKTADPTSTLTGKNVTYTLTVTNNGPVTDTNVVVGDSLPFGVTYVSATSSQGTCSGTTVLQCSIGTMTNGQKVTITVVVNTTQTGTIVNTATVVGALPETTLTNNTSSVSINVTAPPAPKPAPKPARKPVFKPPVVKPAPKPVPPPCYAVVVAPKQLTVGKNATLRLVVTAKNKPIAGVKIEVKGSGILKLSNRTDKSGHVNISLHPKKAGIVLVKPASYKGCANPRIGVIGAFTPPVTG